MNRDDAYLIVYGGGKYGIKATDQLKSKYPIIVIDTDPNCEVAKIYPAVSLPTLKSAIGTQTSTFFQKITDDFSVRFLEGDVTSLSDLLDIRIPLYILPIAPIHVFADLMQYRLKQQNPKLKIRFHAPEIKSNLFPKQLYLFRTDDKYFLSYANFANELCPDNCLAPLDYCPIHDRKKPKTVSNILRDFYQHQLAFIFHSRQLAPGMGGVVGKQYIQAEQDLQNYIESSAQFPLIVPVGTSCRCHGVLTTLHITHEN